MGIAEDGESRRREARGQRRRASHVLLGLVGQSVHEIEIDGADARPAQKAHGVFNDLVGLRTTDLPLHVLVEILHAEAGARHANGREPGDERRVDRARIEFDGVFGDGR